MPRLLRASAFLFAALVAAPLAASAAPRSITLSLVEADGSPGPALDANDVSIAMSRGPDSAGSDPSNQVSISSDLSTFTDPKVLAWISKSGEDAGALITISSGTETTLYLMGGIVSRQLAISHSAGSGSSGSGQVSLSITAKHLTINGYTVN